jgi:hypothetical protein
MICKSERQYVLNEKRKFQAQTRGAQEIFFTNRMAAIKNRVLLDQRKNFIEKLYFFKPIGLGYHENKKIKKNSLSKKKLFKCKMCKMSKNVKNTKLQ